MEIGNLVPNEVLVLLAGVVIVVEVLGVLSLIGTAGRVVGTEVGLGVAGLMTAPLAVREALGGGIRGVSILGADVAGRKPGLGGVSWETAWPPAIARCVGDWKRWLKAAGLSGEEKKPGPIVAAAGGRGDP